MIKIELCLNDEQEYQKLRDTLLADHGSEYDPDFEWQEEDTVVTIQKDEIAYELYVNGNQLACATHQLIEESVGGTLYRTIDKSSATEILEESETLEDFIQRIFRFVL